MIGGHSEVLYRYRHLPRSSELLAGRGGPVVVVVVVLKASTTVNNVCQVLADFPLASEVCVLSDCIADELQERCAGVLKHTCHPRHQEHVVGSTVQLPSIYRQP